MMCEKSANNKHTAHKSQHLLKTTTTTHTHTHTHTHLHISLIRHKMAAMQINIDNLNLLQTYQNTKRFQLTAIKTMITFI